jgi:Icc-related predicted phosphoesterase
MADRTLRILHISDTHNLHGTIEREFPFPEADILMHTGDFTNNGTLSEWTDFNDWLGSLRPRFRHIIVVIGNHDLRPFTRGSRYDYSLPCDDPRCDPAYGSLVLTNATHVLNGETALVEGLKVHGIGWIPGQSPHQPDNVNGNDDAGVRVFAVPEDVDILLTHCPPDGVLDRVFSFDEDRHWGGSPALLDAVQQAKPKVHLFGHLHEMRGVWAKPAPGQRFAGGVVEPYCRPVPGAQTWGHFEPPDPGHPCQVISNAAMTNKKELEGLIEGGRRTQRIGGGGHLILAHRSQGCWSFRADLAHLGAAAGAAAAAAAAAGGCALVSPPSNRPPQTFALFLVPLAPLGFRPGGAADTAWYGAHAALCSFAPAVGSGPGAHGSSLVRAIKRLHAAAAAAAAAATAAAADPAHLVDRGRWAGRWTVRHAPLPRAEAAASGHEVELVLPEADPVLAALCAEAASLRLVGAHCPADLRVVARGDLSISDIESLERAVRDALRSCRSWEIVLVQKKHAGSLEFRESAMLYW